MPAITTTPADAVMRCITLLTDLADQGKVAWSELLRVVDEIDLGPSDFEQFADALASSGLSITGNSPTSERSPSYDAAFFAMYAARPKNLLTSAEVEQLVEAAKRGEAARLRLSEHSHAAAERVSLLRQQARGVEARDTLVAHNLGLVLYAARKYRKRCRSMEIGDLFQEGVLGLMRATHTFNPSLGYQFSTYAMHWIRQAIKRAVDNRDRTVRLPVHIEVQVARVRASRHAFHVAGKRPTNAAIAAQASVPVNQVGTLRRLDRAPGPTEGTQPCQQDQTGTVEMQLDPIPRGLRNSRARSISMVCT